MSERGHRDGEAAFVRWVADRLRPPPMGEAQAAAFERRVLAAAERPRRRWVVPALAVAAAALVAAVVTLGAPRSQPARPAVDWVSPLLDAPDGLAEEDTDGEPEDDLVPADYAALSAVLFDEI